MAEVGPDGHVWVIDWYNFIVQHNPTPQGFKTSNGAGVSGWGFPSSREQTVSMIVRLRFANDETEDHELRNGVHFADCIRHIDAPNSEFALLANGGQQMRYLAIYPRQASELREIEFLKGLDQTAPVVMAVTLELP